MIIDPDSSVQRDGKRLKSINLIDDKWYTINRLIIILEDFAEATEYLGRSNYITISLIYSLLAIISKNIIPDDFNIEVVDLTSPNTAFDDDIDYEDVSEDESITQQSKRRKSILIFYKTIMILKIVLKQHYISLLITIEKFYKSRKC